MLARVNSFREEPGGTGACFVHDLNGPLYILDKKSKALTTYLDFNGRDGRPGSFTSWPRKSALPMAWSPSSLIPTTASNGRFYTVHIEDPALPASAVPDNTNVPAFNVDRLHGDGADRDARARSRAKAC